MKFVLLPIFFFILTNIANADEYYSWYSCKCMPDIYVFELNHHNTYNNFDWRSEDRKEAQEKYSLYSVNKSDKKENDTPIYCEFNNTTVTVINNRIVITYKNKEIINSYLRFSSLLVTDSPRCVGINIEICQGSSAWDAGATNHTDKYASKRCKLLLDEYLISNAPMDTKKILNLFKDE